MTLTRVRRPLRAAGIATIVVVAFLAPKLLSSYWLSLTITALSLLALAIAWNLVGGYAGQLSFAHPAFYGLGAYMYTLVMVHTGLPWWIAMGCAGLIASVGSLLVYPCFRTQGSYFAIATLMLTQILLLVTHDWGPGGENGLVVPIAWGIALSTTYYVNLVIVLAAAVAVAFATRGRIGLAISAIRANQSAASALGVNAGVYKQVIFAISSFFVGIAGAAYAAYAGYIDPESAFSLDHAVIPIMIVILGGIGTFSGPFVGSLVWILISDYSRRATGNASVNVIVYGAVTLAVIVIFPSGLVGIWALVKRAGRATLRLAGRPPEIGLEP